MSFEPGDPTTLADWLPTPASATGAILRGETVAAPPAPPPEEDDLQAVTHYAAPTAQGTGDGLSAANAFTIASFIALPPSPGDHLQLKSGTMAAPLSYTGSNSVINPNGVSGTESDRIVVSCEVDGGALLDGQSARDMVSFLGSSWWVLQGFNIRNGVAGNVRFRSGSSNNVTRRVVAWNGSADAGQSLIGVGNNVHIPCFGNLVEDCAAFGEGQEQFQSSQGGQGTVFRRLWAMGHTWMASNISYQCHENINENSVITWASLGAAIESEIESRATHAIGRIDKGVGGAPVNKQSNSKLLGCISYIPSEADISAGTKKLSQLLDVSANQGGLTIKDMVLLTEQQLHNGRLRVLRNMDITSPLSLYHDITEIRGVGLNTTDVLGSGWDMSNRVRVETVAQAIAAGANPFQTTAGAGARVYYRYVNGVLTDVPLWPWPMDARIRAALTLSGRNPDVIFRGAGNGVTEMMESIFGPIPGV